MLSILQRIFVHWKTTLGGLSLTAILSIIATTYVPGMSWKHWLIIALPALIGALMKDPSKK